MFKHLRDCTLIVSSITFFIYLATIYSQDIFNASLFVFNAIGDLLTSPTYYTLQQNLEHIRHLLKLLVQVILATGLGLLAGLIATDVLHRLGALSPSMFFNKKTYGKLNDTSKNLYILGCLKLGVCSIPLFTSLAYLPDISPIKYHDTRDLIAPALTFITLSLILICTSNKYLNDILENTDEDIRNTYYNSNNFSTKYKIKFKETHLAALKASGDTTIELYDRYMFEGEKIIANKSRQ